MPRQFIACKFRDEDERAYTYHYDGEEPLAEGDRVIVSGKRGERTVIVAQLGVDQPPEEIETAPIVGKAPPKPEPEADEANRAND